MRMGDKRMITDRKLRKEAKEKPSKKWMDDILKT